jgi:hypothetical protein
MRFHLKIANAACLGLLWLCLCSAADACNIPVFRYALERWRPDVCDVIVFHRGLNQEQTRMLEDLQRAALENGGLANIHVISSDLRTEKENARIELWASVSRQANVTLPHVVIQTKLGTGKTINHWQGGLVDLHRDNLLDSPIRDTLTQRLLKGDAVVWLLLKSQNEEKNVAIKERLSMELSRLSKTLELPDGIGLPGSELFTEVPLLLKFSILELDRNDQREQMLVKLITGFEPDSNEEPLLVPVFGRGRALEVIPAKQLENGLIGDLTMFLCGACSCQVKDRNPGFDLLLSIDWNKQLYGDDANVPELVTTLEREPSKPPQVVPIPPGRKK